MSQPFAMQISHYVNNPLLQRSQMAISLQHAGLGCLKKEQIQQRLAKQYKVTDARLIVVYGLRTVFGGGRSECFALIYNSVDAMKKVSPKHRLLKLGLISPSTGMSRRARKETKNRRQRVRGIAKAKVSGSKK